MKRYILNNIFLLSLILLCFVKLSSNLTHIDKKRQNNTTEDFTAISYNFYNHLAVSWFLFCQSLSY